jgi:MFS family permease
VTADADHSPRDRLDRATALSALRFRNFRLIWLGQLISSIGGQMQQVAIAWHLYDLTGSSFQVGLVGFFGIAPFLVLSFAGGAIADRFDRKRILVSTQVMTMLGSLVLVGATFSGNVSPAVIFAVAFASGMTRSFDAPARQALIPNLVPAEELGNALTLNTILRQLATIVGPSLGGLVLGFFGVGAAYALNSLSFLAIIVALLVMDPLPPLQRSRQAGWELLGGGLRFVRGEPVVLGILCLDFVVNLLGTLTSLMPVFADQVLHVGEEGLGFLYAAPAVGAVAGAVFLGAMGGRWRSPAVILVMSAILGLCTVAFGLSVLYPLSLLLLFAIGFVDAIGEVMRATWVQLRTPNELRGRVTALTVIFTNGGPQLGQMEAGALATALGPMEAAVIGGAGVLLATGAFAFNPHLRREPPPRAGGRALVSTEAD